MVHVNITIKSRRDKRVCARVCVAINLSVHFYLTNSLSDIFSSSFTLLGFHETKRKKVIVTKPYIYDDARLAAVCAQQHTLDTLIEESMRKREKEGSKVTHEAHIIAQGSILFFPRVGYWGASVFMCAQQHSLDTLTEEAMRRSEKEGSKAFPRVC